MPKESIHDIIIIGAGIAGLYSAYNIKKMSPKTTFLILEQNKKQWLGGRMGNENFYGTSVVTGAGIGRKDKDDLIQKLLKDLHIKTTDFTVDPAYAPTIKNPVDVIAAIKYLRKQYKEEKSSFGLKEQTFKQFAMKHLGKKMYNDFTVSASYTDYENEDVEETLYHYGMEDNSCCWTGINIPWHTLVYKLVDEVGEENIQASTKIVSLEHVGNGICGYKIISSKGKIFYCKKVIIATTIYSAKLLIPGASLKGSLYQNIHGQPFLRVYGKFGKAGSATMNKHIGPSGYLIVPGALHAIITMDVKKGVYMIAYTDNEAAKMLSSHLKNDEKNREFFVKLLRESIGIRMEEPMDLIAIKDYYWNIGTHYYGPLPNGFKTRSEFIKKAQHPEPNMLVVGEMISRDQGWSKGALESVAVALTKKWIDSTC
uniref:Amine oxidase domain-containing protein n=1 Tax=viral metagenome TaxID=1070528 RepID=A0A6C0F860_9ZZZZ